MSEVREYPLEVRVEMKGFDKSRYAVLQADSTVTIQVSSTGFNALLYKMKGKTLVLPLNVNGEGMRKYLRSGKNGDRLCRSVAVDDLGNQLASQLTKMGMHMKGSAKDSLRIVLAERKSKVFPVDISSVETSFAEGYGLYGEPSVNPAEVTLYGDEETLSQIDRVTVKPLKINDLKGNGSYTLTIDTAWRGNDIYASTDKVTLYVPVEQYVEREFELPIALEGADSVVRVNLYPDKVTLHVWVPRPDVATMTAERFSVSVDYRDVMVHAAKLKPRLTRFPQKVRFHSLSPAEVGYVVIK